MSRRTKNEMEQMKNECKYYLLRTNNDPHKAHEKLIKECLESGQQIPYYIKSVKDFINVSYELATELNRKEQMKKADKQKAEQKENTIQTILNVNLETLKQVWRTYKNDLNQNDKMVLVDMITMISMNELSEKQIDQSIINAFNHTLFELIDKVKEGSLTA